MVDVLIVGGGPAGITAGIYAARSGLNTLLLERETFGGQIASSPKVENYPSIISISGEELVSRMLEQALEFGVSVDVENVTAINKVDDYFEVVTDYNTYQAKSVILATGVTHRTIKAENVEEFMGEGISYCAVCDGPFHKGHDVAVIGDGNSAMQYTISLSQYCNKVYVCTLFDKFFGEKSVEKVMRSRSNIKIVHNCSLNRVGGDSELKSAEFTNLLTKEVFSLDIQGLFIAIGHVPHNEDFKNVVELDNQGYILGNELCETSTPGIFVAGDCRKKTFRQVSTACADGTIAALSAIKYLDSKKV